MVEATRVKISRSMVKSCKCTECECKEIRQFEKSFEVDIPYIENQEEGVFYRIFSKDTEPHLLKWHYDEEDRLVTPVEENDWKFQFDNKLPQNIDQSIFIPKGMIHRIIKGTTDLHIKIEKNANNPARI